ncbi:hypothetical protein LY76DRAFT_372672 [Colletotrichum caudatum]|nr:hypothetical protein LY76DRAFT_372672 [Colletotrichum caudatum]
MERLLSHQDASRSTNNGPSHSVHISEYQEQPPRSPNQSRERAIDYETSDGQVADYSDIKCPLGTCDQPCQTSDLLQHFQQHVVCREVCVFCFEQFTSASKYISHTLEHHLTENDKVNLNYAEARREKLMAEAEIKLLEVLCNEEPASIQGLRLSAAKAGAYHSFSGPEPLSQPGSSAPSNAAFPSWNAYPATESTLIDISPLDWTLYGGPDLLTTGSHQQALSYQQNIDSPFVPPYVGTSSYNTSVPNYTGSRATTTPESVASSISPQTMGWSKHPHTKPQPFAVSESTDAALVATTSETCLINIDYRCDWCCAMNLEIVDSQRRSVHFQSGHHLWSIGSSKNGIMRLTKVIFASSSQKAPKKVYDTSVCFILTVIQSFKSSAKTLHQRNQSRQESGRKRGPVGSPGQRTLCNCAIRQLQRSRL